MRISDWSSDVCSSDLQLQPRVMRLGQLHSAFQGTFGGGGKVGGGEYHLERVGLEFAVHGMPSWMRRSLCTGSRSEEHTSELQSLMRISYAVFCLKKTTYSPLTTNQ